VRSFIPFGFLTLLLIFGVIAGSSCTLATREVPEGGADADDDGAPPPAPTDAADGDGSDVSTDCGCCAQAILPVLPFCSGKVAFGIPAGDCPNACPGPEAFALCKGGCYTACSCTLPEGYSLEDAGFYIPDAGAEDAPEETTKPHDSGEHPKDGSSADAGQMDAEPG
jgi:hypothetical protein